MLNIIQNYVHKNVILITQYSYYIVVKGY